MTPVLNDLISLAQTPSSALPRRALERARFSLLDWILCGRAGRSDPIAKMMHRFAALEGGIGEASLFGGGQAPARMAALANGAISHALDYDDTHFAHVGHLSVGIYPAALAVAEAQDASASEVVEAFLVGAEAAIRVGCALGARHYNAGFHQTATAGAFGATVAVGRLMRLPQDQLRAALGLCATRASGLKSQFGTMGKPYNAGLSAANGVECARLAALGMTSADDGLEGAQGFLETHHAEGPRAPAGRILFEDNLYKLHACCHGLHAMIEGVRGLAPLADISAVTVRTNPRWLRVCDIKAPRTGLEVKFSYAWLAGMTLRGDPTGDPTLYSDALAQDPELAAFAARVQVVGDPTLSDLQAEGLVDTSDGRALPWAHDLGAPVPGLQDRLRTKAAQVLGPAEGDRLWGLLPALPELSARDLGQLLR